MLYSGNILAEVPGVDQNKYNTESTGFVKNTGQVYDYDKNLVSKVLYSLNADNSSIFLTTSGLTYSIIEREFQNLTINHNLNKSVEENNTIDNNVPRLDIELIVTDIAT